VQWRSADLAPGVNALACAGPTFCVVAFGETGSDEIARFDGSRWTAPTTVEQYEGRIVSIACPEVGRCIALTDLGQATVLRGGKWSPLTAADPVPAYPYPGMVESVACSSASYCVAVNGLGAAATYDGSRWSPSTTVDAAYPLNALSCDGRQFCVAVDGGGRALVLDAGRWSSPDSIDASPLTSISCPTRQYCAATDLLGRVVQFNGTRWSSPRPISSLGRSPLTISCPAAGSCLAADTTAAHLLGRGVWRSVPSDDGARSGFVSCPAGAPNFCAVASRFGIVETVHNLFR
jgi:hypothetical protein